MFNFLPQILTYTVSNFFYSFIGLLILGTLPMTIAARHSTYIYQDSKIGSHPVWPRDIFGPTLTLTWRILWPKAHFGPVRVPTSARNNFSLETTLAQQTSAWGPKFQKCHFSSVLAFHRLRECLRVKSKQKLSTLPGLAKNWKICLAKAKNKKNTIIWWKKDFLVQINWAQAC